jgi:hypothetical protein
VTRGLGVVLLCAGCSAHTGYQRLPERYTALTDSSGNSAAFVFEILSAFGAASAQRLEFRPTANGWIGTRTNYSSGRRPEMRQIAPTEAARILDRLVAFDWEHLEAIPASGVLVPDPLVVCYKAKFGGRAFDGRVELFPDSPMEHLLLDIGFMDKSK